MQEKNVWQRLRQSANELNKTRTLVVTALFIALNVTLDALNIRIQLTPQLRIGFGFLTSAMVGMLFGPVVAMMAGAAGDMMGYLFNNGGGAYFPGFTITAVLAGLIWGIALYHRPVTYRRAFCTKLVINLFLNIFLNSLWLKLLYGKGLLADLPMRIFKNVAMLPLEALMLVTVSGIVLQAQARSRRAA